MAFSFVYAITFIFPKGHLGMSYKRNFVIFAVSLRNFISAYTSQIHKHTSNYERL